MSKKVLVVEDDQALQDAIVLKLKSEGIVPLPAKSCVEAIKILTTERVVDAVWLDHYLFGECDGLAVIKRVKEDKKWHDVPVFVVSNTITPEKVQPYFDLGAEKYYVKSDYRLEEIVADIKAKWAEKE